MTLNIARYALAPAALAAALALGAGATAHAQSVEGVDVTGRAPTSLTLNIAGKGLETVRTEVREAAGTVCQNAFINREIPRFDINWCRSETHAVTMSQYHRVMKANRGIASEQAAIGVVLVAAR